MKPVHAAKASAPPTLMRRTPSAAISSTLQANVPNHEKIEWLWRDRRDERLDLVRRLRTRREEHVCARCGVRLQAPDGLAERIRMADVVALGSCSQQHVFAYGPDSSIACRAARTRSTAIGSS